MISRVSILLRFCLFADSIKDDKRIKWGEEDAIARENLDEIIKESMQKFLEFVKTYKDDKNVFYKVPRYRMSEIKDKEISELLEDIQTQLHKVGYFFLLIFL